MVKNHHFHTIHKFNCLFIIFINSILGLGSANNQFHTPKGIDIDSNTGTLYVSDSQNHRVMAYASGATSGTIAAGGNGPGIATNQLFFPSGLYWDSASNSLFVANTGANNIVRWVMGATQWSIVVGDSNGIPGNNSNQLYEPYDVTFDSTGNMYVADYRNHRIQFFRSGQTNGITIAGTGVSNSNSNQLNGPISVAVDSQLNVYVSDSSNHRIQKFIRY